MNPLVVFSNKKYIEINHIRKQYLFALIILVILYIGSFFILVSIDQSRKSEARIINISGRQRMLSQRIAKLVLLLEKNENAEYRSVLKSCIALMKQSHHFLINDKPEIHYYLSPTIKEMYFGKSMNLNFQVENYLSRALEFAKNDNYDPNAIEYLTGAANLKLLQSLDKVVKQYENESRFKFELFYKVGLVILAILLLVLLLELIFIFIPIDKHIVSETEKLEKLVEDLHEATISMQKFTFAISHDLKEPTRIIANSADLILIKAKDRLDQGLQSELKEIKVQAKLLASINNSLLDLVKIRVPSIILVDINLVLDYVLENLEYNQELVLTKYALPRINADFGSLVMIFSALIENAIKFKKMNTECKIHITYKNVKGKHQFSITDNGIGINTKYFESIFEPFFSLQSKSETKSPGMGLALCKKIVEKNGGAIWLESEEGIGSTFYFTI